MAWIFSLISGTKDIEWSPNSGKCTVLLFMEHLPSRWTFFSPPFTGNLFSKAFFHAMDIQFWSICKHANFCTFFVLVHWQNSKNVQKFKLYQKVEYTEQENSVSTKTLNFLPRTFCYLNNYFRLHVCLSVFLFVSTV